MKYLNVAVAAPVADTLTYSCSDEDARLLVPGIRLLVPLGSRRVTGYLLDMTDSAPSDYAVRQISEVLDRQPLFPREMIPFFRWLSSYYHYPLGETIKIALPGGLVSRSERHLRLIAEKEELLIHWRHAGCDGALPEWWDELLRSGSLSPARLRPLWRSRKWRELFQGWQELGLVQLEERVSSDRNRPKLEQCVRRTGQSCASLRLKVSEKKALELLREMAGDDERGAVALRDLRRRYGGAGKALQSLAQRHLVVYEEREVLRDPFGEQPPSLPVPECLSDEQQAVLSELLPAVQHGGFSTFLLHGVTGSGKTEVYLRAAEKALAQGRGVVVLVPEIALASQLEAHFHCRFPGQVALLHSGLSDGERYDQWRGIMAGRARIVIGARSAIFAPLASPGLIIVDEEHDGSYKQEDSLRYQARDMAVLRGKLQECPVLLGSATPSLASYFHAVQGKYRLLALQRRIENRPLPAVEIIDLRRRGERRPDHPFLSAQLLAAMEENLAAGDQSILFLNRRGYANLMICADCGTPVKCRHCDISLTLHKGLDRLCCHYCGFATRSAILCPACSSPRVREIGFGTERVEEELRIRFPEARIGRIDRDTSSSRTKFLALLKEVHHRRIDILVGTQMITKGHHFPHVTLVGVIWADAGLGLPDFKAGERTFQLIAQVTGRAGRGEKPGRVIIQTHQPDHYALSCARNHDYTGFFEQELQLRRGLGYPPFARLINLRFSGAVSHKVEEAAQATAQAARSLAGARRITVLGPAPAPLARLRDKYRWQLLLKGEESGALHDLCRLLAARADCRHAGVDLQLDVDPESML